MKPAISPAPAGPPRFVAPDGFELDTAVGSAINDLYLAPETQVVLKEHGIALTSFARAFGYRSDLKSE